MMQPTDLRFNPESIQAMIDELETYYDEDQMTGWEQAFYESVRDLVLEGVSISKQQFDKLLELYKDYCE